MRAKNRRIEVGAPADLMVLESAGEAGAYRVARVFRGEIPIDD